MLSRFSLLARFACVRRTFSTPLQTQPRITDAEWEARRPYQLTRHIEYTKGAYVVFEQDLKGVRQMPHEIKETSMKNTIGVILFGVLSFIHPYLSVPIPLFILNMVIRSLRYTLAAIYKIELLEGGQQVRLTKKTGGSFVVDVAAITKKEDERTLMKTYMEPYLFPIEVNNKLYYIYGRNFEPIRNGEAFRAIINGKPINNCPPSNTPTP